MPCHETWQEESKNKHKTDEQHYTDQVVSTLVLQLSKSTLFKTKSLQFFEKIRSPAAVLSLKKSFVVFLNLSYTTG